MIVPEFMNWAVIACCAVKPHQLQVALMIPLLITKPPLLKPLLLNLFSVAFTVGCKFAEFAPAGIVAAHKA